MEELGDGATEVFNLVGHSKTKQEAGAIVVQPKGW
jgi:hypothetical protein